MTNQTMSAHGARQFSIGNVLSTSFVVFFRNFILFIILAALISAPYIAASVIVDLGKLTPIYEQTRQVPLGFWRAPAIVLPIEIITSALVSASLAYGTFQDLRGHRANFSDSLKRSVSVLTVVILAAVVFSVLLGVGMVLLLVPGFMVWAALWVYVPVIVVEKEGAFGAFTRSRVLTKGRRWSIFGLLFIFLAANWFLTYVTRSVLVPALGSGGVYVSWALRIVLSAFYAVMAAVSYYFLRADKEGVAIGDIAKVFD
jgi:hypothetical protein